jgi:3-deoxy-D-manno-octulosonic-acid transferase
MLSRIYNALWYPALPFALIAGGGCNARNRRERLGAVSINNDRNGSDALRIWVHASSVGEIEAVRPIVVSLEREIANASVVFTTMTVTGRDAARRRIPELSACQLAPLDYPAAVRAFLARVRPHLVIIAEAELWPNFFIESKRLGAKVAVVNGRVSKRSLRHYRFARPLLAEALMHADLILVQTDDDAKRYRELGAPRNRVLVTGNTKFDFDSSPASLRPALANFAIGRPILVAGSTAPGEERMVLNAYRNLVENFPALALVIAPRHLERAAEVEQELRATGIAYTRARALPSSRSASPLPTITESILLLDTMGELRALYHRAAIAFVGGSMAPGRGGQSLAEPASVSVPVLFGPHYENQRQVGDALIEAGCGRVVNDAAQLESTCAELLADETAMHAAGEHARYVMERLGGGAAATLQHLKALLALA